LEIVNRIDVEQKARSFLQPRLSVYLDLVVSFDRRFFRLIQKLSSATGDPYVARVRSLFAARVGNDLHVVGVLAESGYSIQACTAAASMIENGFRLAFVMESLEMSGRWWDAMSSSEARPKTPKGPPCSMCGSRPKLANPSPPPPWENVRHCVENVCNRLDLADAIPYAYQRYKEMCKAKHSEPEYLRWAGEQKDDKRNLVRHEFGPRAGREDIWFGLKALHHSLYAAGLLANVLVNELAEPDEVASLERDGEILSNNPYQTVAIHGRTSE